jgi:hypothetical protein
VPKGAWHRIENHGRAQVVIIEVQHGPYLGEDDIIRRQDDYGRSDGAESPPRRGTTGRSSTPVGAAATSTPSRGRRGAPGSGTRRQ